jgi:hypothetical protein
LLNRGKSFGVNGHSFVISFTSALASTFALFSAFSISLIEAKLSITPIHKQAIALPKLDVQAFSKADVLFIKLLHSIS